MHSLFFIVVICLLSSCGGLDTKNNEPIRSRVRRKGNVKVPIPTDVAEKGFFANFTKCAFDPKADQLIGSKFDLFTGLFPSISRFNLAQKTRYCFKSKIKEGSKRICDSREALLRNKKSASTSAEKNAIDGQLHALKDIEDDFTQNWQEMGQKFKESKSDNLIVEDEVNAWVSLLENAANTSCFDNSDNERSSGNTRRENLNNNDRN